MISTSTYRPKNLYAKKNEVRVYENADEAFEFLNSWNSIKQNYNKDYDGKTITQVVVTLAYERPMLAAVHYTSGFSFGINFLSLDSLLDEQDFSEKTPHNLSKSRVPNKK